MKTLEIVYNNTNFINEIYRKLTSKVSIIAVDERIYKDRKKAFKLKGGFSARQTPFAVLKNENNKVIKAFYSEADECNIDNILNYANK